MKMIKLTDMQYQSFCSMFDTLIKRRETDEKKRRFKEESKNEKEMLEAFYKVFTENTEQ